MNATFDKNIPRIGFSDLLTASETSTRPLSERMQPVGPRYPETLAKVGFLSDSRAASPRLEVAPEALAEGRREAALGNNAKYVGRLEGNDEKKPQENKAISAKNELRNRLFFLQRTAGSLLEGKSRVGLCRWAVQRNDQPVEVHRADDSGRAFYAGLQSCGSVWACPVCSSKISEVRRQEMNHLLAGARDRGFAVVMVTLTASHKRNDDLAEQLSKLKEAKRKLRQRRDWKALKPVLVGSVTATEVTYGSSGWHTHFHEIFVLRCDQVEAISTMQCFDKPWLVALQSQGLSGKLPYAYQVQDGSRAGEYAAKWGVAEEIVLGQRKTAKGEGRTPMQLLHDAGIEGDVRACKLFAEFANVFKGARQLVWSNGLKAEFGIGEVTDEQAAEDGGEVDLMGVFSKDDWTGNGERGRGVRMRRVRVLEAAETGDYRAVLDAAYGEPDALPESSMVIEDDGGGGG